MMSLNEKWVIFLEHSKSIDPNADKLLRLKLFRNSVLLRCDDWVEQSKTLSETEKEDGAIFIQTLKDLPQNFYTDPDEAVFPVPPKFLEEWVLL